MRKSVNRFYYLFQYRSAAADPVKFILRFLADDFYLFEVKKKFVWGGLWIDFSAGDNVTSNLQSFVYGRNPIADILLFFFFSFSLCVNSSEYDWSGGLNVHKRYISEATSRQN